MLHANVAHLPKQSCLRVRFIEDDFPNYRANLSYVGVVRWFLLAGRYLSRSTQVSHAPHTSPDWVSDVSGE